MIKNVLNDLKDCQKQHTLEECWRTDWLKCIQNNKDKDTHGNWKTDIVGSCHKFELTEINKIFIIL